MNSAIAGIMSVWALNWIMQPITTPKPPEVSTELTNHQLFLQKLYADRSMRLRNVTRRMCRIGWDYHRRYCMRLIPYTFKWDNAKKFCMGIKSQLSMAFSRSNDRLFVLNSLRHLNMSKTYVAMGYFAHVEPPDVLDYFGQPELTVRNLAGIDVTKKVKVLRNFRFEGPTINNSRVVFLHRDKLFWTPPGQFGFPYCEYKRKPQEEPVRWEGLPDTDFPKKKRIKD